MFQIRWEIITAGQVCTNESKAWRNRKGRENKLELWFSHFSFALKGCTSLSWALLSPLHYTDIENYYIFFDTKLQPPTFIDEHAHTANQIHIVHTAPVSSYLQNREHGYWDGWFHWLMQTRQNHFTCCQSVRSHCYSIMLVFVYVDLLCIFCSCLYSQIESLTVAWKTEILNMPLVSRLACKLVAVF